MSHAKAYVCSILMQHKKSCEYRLLTDLAVAPTEEEALVHAALLAHPGHGGIDDWIILNKQVQELDREAIERAASEVLGWSKPDNAAGAGAG